MKKKKKKKTTFNLDEAMAEGSESPEAVQDVEDGAGDLDMDDNLDLESFGKKKKKKKKPFSMEELDTALEKDESSNLEIIDEDGGAGDEEEYNLDIDMSTKKKKKKKKMDINELIKEEDNKDAEDRENGMFYLNKYS